MSLTPATSDPRFKQEKQRKEANARAYDGIGHSAPKPSEAAQKYQGSGLVNRSKK